MAPISQKRLTSRLEVRIHFCTLLSEVVLETDYLAINKKLKETIRPSQNLLLKHDILLKPVSYASLDLPKLRKLSAVAKGATPEQRRLVTLFRQAASPARNEAAVFFVDSIVDENQNNVLGCAVPELGAVMLSTNVSRWTFGHEMCHLLGIEGHATEAGRLMYENTAELDPQCTPELVWSELLQLRSSRFARIAK